MLYFGTEIFDGKIYTDFPLEEDVPLEDQDFFLTSDVGGVDYNFRGYGFCISLAWFGDICDIGNPENRFCVRVFEGPRTGGKTFLREFTKSDLKQFKLAFQRAVDFVQQVRVMSDDQIEALPRVFYR